MYLNPKFVFVPCMFVEDEEILYTLGISHCAMKHGRFTEVFRILGTKKIFSPKLVEKMSG